MKQEFNIEKGIPITSKRSRESLYPFKDLDIGDSFVFIGKLNTITAAAVYFSRCHENIKFTIRKIENNKYRVWRIK